MPLQLSCTLTVEVGVFGFSGRLPLRLRSAAEDGRTSSGVKGLTACRSNRRRSSARFP